MKNFLFHIAGAADFRLRSHAPLWLLWTLLPIYLSVFLFSLYKNLGICFHLIFSIFPVFLGSCWIVLTISSDEDLVSKLLLVCALKYGAVFPPRCCDLSLWDRLFENLSKRVPWGSPPGSPLLNYKLKTERYDYSFSILDMEIPLYQLVVYKYQVYHLEVNKLLSILSILSLLSELFGVFCFLESLCSAMASPGATSKKKGKQKVPLETDYLADNIITNCTNDTNSNNIPMLKLPSGGSSSKSKAKNGMGSKPDLSAMFKKLAAARENGKKKKEFTLLGFLIGKPKDFARIFAKIRMEWKPLQGSMVLNVLKFGWFEIGFSNSADFHLIWANRPYHLFSQLLLLKQWYPGFDPTSESISKLDLWVRLHYLPEEFANAAALETIIDGNCVGTFLKMDPSHNGERWNMYTRFCINTDVEKSFGKGVIVPDEHLNQIKFSLWFDDFSPGCGACGKSAHTFRNCPHKNAQTPTIHLTIKKPSSKIKSSDDSASLTLDKAGWNRVGKKNKVLNNPNIAIPNGNIYLSERSGIKVIYESEDSDEGIQHLLDNENVHLDQPIFVSVAADLHPYNLFYEEMSSLTQYIEKGYPSKIPEVSSQNGMELQTTVVANEMSPSQDEGMKISEIHGTDMSLKPPPECLRENELPLCTDTVSISMLLNNSGTSLSEQRTAGVGETRIKAHLVDPMDSESHPYIAESSEPIEKTLNVPQITSTSYKEPAPPQQPDKESSEYSEEQYDYEYDDLLVDDLPEISHSNLLPSISKEVISPIMLSEDPPFSERDLDEFLNNDEMDGQMYSEGTFHSVQNSLHSTSSFVNGMERLLVHQSDKSTSNSNKKRVPENVEDTASSEKRAVKKTKV